MRFSSEYTFDTVFILIKLNVDKPKEKIRMAKIILSTFFLDSGLFTSGTMARYLSTVMTVRVRMEELIANTAVKNTNLHKIVPKPPGNHNCPTKEYFTWKAITVKAYSMSLVAMLITRMLNGPRPADSSLRATWMTKEFPITATRSMAR